MITFIVFTLSLLATTVVSQDVHTTFWTGYGSNDTFSNSDNWSNGAPTTESIAVINDTLCYGCNIYWEDEEIEVAELHLTLTQARSGPQLRLTNTNITVTGKLVIGSEGFYGYSILIELRDSELHLGPESDNWIYSVPNPIVVYDSDVYGRIVNNGTINIVSSGNTDYTQVRIGYDDSYPLTIDNWGFWKAEDELLGVVFYELESYNHYAGWYNSTFLKYDSTGSYYLPQATIEWEDSDFYVHSIDTDPNGSDAAAVEEDAVTDTFNGPVHFDSYYSNSGSSLGSYVKKVVIDAENVEFKWALFEGVNIVLNQDAWFTDSNFTDYANVNASTGAFTAYINGETVFYSSTQFSAVDGGELHVIITEEARVTNGFDTSSTLYIFGSTWFINNGTIEEFSTLYFYVDQQAWIINLGLVAVKESESIYFYASDFPSSAGAEIGKVVNRGTIQLVDSYLYWQETGDFLQCHNAVVKAAVGYPESTDYNYIKFSRAYLNGYFAAYIGKDFDLENSRQQAFTWDKDLASDNEGLYYGDVDGSSTFEEGSEDSLDGIQLCLDTDYGYAYIYSLLHASCSDAPWDYKNNFGGDDNVCETQEVPEGIMELIPRCPSSVECGDLPTKTSGDGQPSSAILQTASLALLVTTLGFLIYQ